MIDHIETPIVTEYAELGTNDCVAMTQVVYTVTVPIWIPDGKPPKDGNEFRTVTLEEYKSKTDWVSFNDEWYFDIASKHCTSEQDARSFAMRWEVLERILKRESPND